jgi:hypothetical protein
MPALLLESLTLKQANEDNRKAKGVYPALSASAVGLVLSLQLSCLHID